jgi:hypothetical protein
MTQELFAPAILFFVNLLIVKKLHDIQNNLTEIRTNLHTIQQKLIDENFSHEVNLNSRLDQLQTMRFSPLKIARKL